MRPIDRVFLITTALVATSTAAFPMVTGYGTQLFQLIVFGAWLFIEKVTSGEFADLHDELVWAVALLLNLMVFELIALPAWVLFRARRERIGGAVLIGWAFLYVMSLFWLFPATDGP